MNLLALDTATEACSVALLCGDRLLSRQRAAPRQHAELLLPWIDELIAEAGLQRADLDAIAVGRGPGGFTGVRLAVAVAQGIAFALDKPLLAVSTLAALALQSPARPGETILACIDARMGELYLGLFERDGDDLVSPLGEEWMARPESVELTVEGALHAVGSGLGAADGTLTTRFAGRWLSCDAQALPQAEAIAGLGQRAWQRGERLRPAELEPAYLRNKVAQTLAERGVH